MPGRAGHSRKTPRHCHAWPAVSWAACIERDRFTHGSQDRKGTTRRRDRLARGRHADSRPARFRLKLSRDNKPDRPQVRGIDRGKERGHAKLALDMRKGGAACLEGNAATPEFGRQHIRKVAGAPRVDRRLHEAGALSRLEAHDPVEPLVASRRASGPSRASRSACAKHRATREVRRACSRRSPPPTAPRTSHRRAQRQAARGAGRSLRSWTSIAIVRDAELHRTVGTAFRSRSRRTER